METFIYGFHRKLYMPEMKKWFLIFHVYVYVVYITVEMNSVSTSGTEDNIKMFCFIGITKILWWPVLLTKFNMNNMM